MDFRANRKIFTNFTHEEEQRVNILYAEHIDKSYKTPQGILEILKDQCLALEEGEMAAVMGPSGSGKTTLFQILSGIDIPDRGNVWFEGENLMEMTQEQRADFRRKHMGMVFQDFQLLESLNVRENILLPLVLDGVEAKEQDMRCEKIMDILGITTQAEKGLTQLSGGQKQRTAIARALIGEPKLVLADEPTGNLDRSTTVEVMKCMRELNCRLSTAFLVITHDSYVASCCDRVIQMGGGQI